MSAGNLHPVELYVVCGELPGIPAGVYHFAPAEFGLTMLRRGDFRPALVGAAGETSVASSPATLVLTGLPWRAGWKYGERGYRHLYWDAGAVLANAGWTATRRAAMSSTFSGPDPRNSIAASPSCAPFAGICAGWSRGPRVSTPSIATDPVDCDPQTSSASADSTR
jgi:hypothetical protein